MLTWKLSPVLQKTQLMAFSLPLRTFNLFLRAIPDPILELPIDLLEIIAEVPVAESAGRSLTETLLKLTNTSNVLPKVMADAIINQGVNSILSSVFLYSDHVDFLTLAQRVSALDRDTVETSLVRFAEAFDEKTAAQFFFLGRKIEHDNYATNNFFIKSLTTPCTCFPCRDNFADLCRSSGILSILSYADYEGTLNEEGKVVDANLDPLVQFLQRNKNHFGQPDLFHSHNRESDFDAQIYTWQFPEGEGRNCTAFVFRGTEPYTALDASSSMNMELRSVGWGLFKGTRVKKSYYRQIMEFGSENAIAKAVETAVLKGHHILITGHSLGGGLATVFLAWLFGFWLEKEHLSDQREDLINRTALITFGATKVGDYSFQQVFEETKFHAWRFVYGSEFAPMVPPIPFKNSHPSHAKDYRHVGQFAWIHPPQSQIHWDQDKEIDYLNELSENQKLHVAFVDHLLTKTVNNLKSWIEQNEFILPHCKPLQSGEEE